MTDKELIRQIQSGNTHFANELIERYYSQILRYCTWHCSNASNAEDLTQETFYRFFRDISQYHNKGKFKAYLYTIAYHLCVDEARRMKPEELPEDMQAQDAELKRIEDQDEVHSLLSRLSPPQREAVLLHFGEQLNFREISIITGAPVRTIQSRVRRALAIMRKEQVHEEAGNEKGAAAASGAASHGGSTAKVY